MTNYEIFIALVAPRGISVEKIIQKLEASVGNYGYKIKRVNLLDINSTSQVEQSLNIQNRVDIESRYLSGLRELVLNEVNEDAPKLYEPHDLISSLIIKRVQELRNDNEKYTVYIIDNVTHPKELNALKAVYKDSLFTIGITGPLLDRVNLKKEQFKLEGYSDSEALTQAAKYIYDDYSQLKETIEIDGKCIDVSNDLGKTYLLSDFFINLNSESFKCNIQGLDELLSQSIERYVDLIFGAPIVTPTQSEHSMFLAYTSALRSGDLSRQVGSAIVNELNDVIALGANEVPKSGGGQYWADNLYIANTAEDEAKLKQSFDQRDYVIGYDTNAVVKDKLTDELIQLFVDKALISESNRAEAELILQKSTLKDITEYGRVVHAEMSALMSAARNGTGVKGMHMFCTTYPCHNCAKHLVAAGIDKVQYIEPYPKSRAADSHDDSIFDPEKLTIALDEENKQEAINNITEAYLDINVKRNETSNKSSAIVNDNVIKNKLKLVFEPYSGVGPSRYVDLFSMNMGSGRKIKRKSGSQAIQLDRGTISVPRIPITSSHNEFFENEFMRQLEEKLKQSFSEIRDNVLKSFHTKYKLRNENRQTSRIKFWNQKNSYGYIVSETGKDFPFNEQNIEDKNYIPKDNELVSFVPLKGESVTFADKILKIPEQEIDEKVSTYSDSKVKTSTIKFLNEGKNFGHIKSNQPIDYYFRFEQVSTCSKDKLKVGIEVSFESCTSVDGKPQAKNVKVIV